LVAMGWGISLYIASTVPATNLFLYLLSGAQGVCAVFVLYFLFREHVWPSLPPASVLSPNSASIIIGLVVWGWYMLVDVIVSLTQISKRLSAAADLGATMQLLQNQIVDVVDEQRRNELLVQFATLSQNLSVVSQSIKSLRFGEATISPQVTTQVENLRLSVRLELERQGAELTMTKVKDNLLLLQTLHAFAGTNELQLPDDLLAPAELEDQLAEGQNHIQQGHYGPITAKTEEMGALHERLESLKEGIETIQLSESLVKAPAGDVNRLRALAETVGYFELGPPEISGVVNAYQTAYQAYSNTNSDVFEVKADLSAELNAAWQGLQNSKENLQKQLQRESYEWQSQEAGGLYVYIPKALKQNESRQLVVVVTDEYPKPQASIEFECALTAVGKPAATLKIPESGRQVIAYDIWSEAAGRGSIQVVLDGVRSGPLFIRVLPTSRQIIEDASKSILIGGPLITVLLVIAQLPVSTAAIYGGAATSIMTVGFLAVRYLPGRPIGSLFRRG
jgi:hypothetical protein